MSNEGCLEPPADFSKALASVGLVLQPHQIQSLGRFLHLLLEQNQTVNLTAIRDPAQAWSRHILESLALWRFIGTATSLVDVGSGGGMPGFPLAIVQPQLKVVLVEATGKKANFLLQAAADMGMDNLHVLAQRAETLGQDPSHRQRYDLATARAVGPMNVMLELTLPLIRPGGRLLALKGRQVQAELDGAADALILLGAGEVRLHQALEGTDDEAVVVEVLKERPTPAQYPRRPGTPKKEPLGNSICRG